MSQGWFRQGQDMRVLLLAFLGISIVVISGSARACCDRVTMTLMALDDVVSEHGTCEQKNIDKDRLSCHDTMTNKYIDKYLVEISDVFSESKAEDTHYDSNQRSLRIIDYDTIRAGLFSKTTSSLRAAYRACRMSPDDTERLNCYRSVGNRTEVIRESARKEYGPVDLRSLVERFPDRSVEVDFAQCHYTGSEYRCWPTRSGTQFTVSAPAMLPWYDARKIRTHCSVPRFKTLMERDRCIRAFRFIPTSVVGTDTLIAGSIEIIDPSARR